MPRDSDRTALEALNGLSRPLLGLAAAGFLVRILFVWFEPATQPIADERTWTNWAIGNLLSAKVGLNPFRTRMVFYPPIYPYFIALSYAPFGTLTAVKLAQAGVGAALVPAVGRVGALVFGARAGVVAAGLAAFYPDLVWFGAHFWSEIVFLTILWWAIERLLVAHETGRRSHVVVAGLLWGLGILTRETILYLTPLVGIWLALAARRQGGPVRGGLFVATALLVVAPWTARNAIVFDGALVPVSTAGGLNLWQGNAGLTRQQVYDLYAQVHGRVEQYNHARRKGLEAIWARQPTWLFEKIRDEMPRFWEADSLALIHIQRGAYGPVRPVAAVSAAAVVLLPYLALVALFVIGVASLPVSSSRLLLLGLLVSYNSLHVVTHGFARYRLPIMPVLFLFAAAAFVELRTRGWPALSPRRRALAVALSLAFVALLIPSAQTLLRHPAYDLSSPSAPPAGIDASGPSPVQGQRSVGSRALPIAA